MNAKNERVERTCLECDILFLAKRCEVNRGNALYCCASCARSGSQRKGRGIAFATCLECGRSFSYPFRSRTKNLKKAARTRQFCCNKCTAVYFGKRRSASVGPFDHAGKNRKDTLKDQRLLRLIVKESGECCDCGSTEHLEAHHILERHKRPDLRWEPSNIEVLCNDCHAKRHPGIAPLIRARKTSRKPSPTKICATCGNSFKIKGNRYDAAIWCSKKCRGGLTRAKYEANRLAARGPTEGWLGSFRSPLRSF